MRILRSPAFHSSCLVCLNILDGRVATVSNEADQAYVGVTVEKYAVAHRIRPAGTLDETLLRPARPGHAR
jgi:hypothetical protein